MQCVILAGGLGTRMQQIAPAIPKSLLLVGEHPFLKYQLDALGRQGIDRVVLCIGHRGEQIRRYLDSLPPGITSIRVVDEGETRKGTGGALRLALDQGALDPTFMVMYGDSFLPIDFAEVWAYFKSRTESALMTVLRNADAWDRSNACFDGDKVTLYDKKVTPKPVDMRYIDYGLTLWLRSVVEQEIPKDAPYDLSDLLSVLSRRKDLAGYEVEKRFYEVGSPSGLADFQRYVEETSKL